MTIVLRLIRVLAFVMIILVVLAFVTRFIPPVNQLAEINYSTFLDDVKANRVASVVFQGDMLYGTLKDQQQFKMHKPEAEDSALIGTLNQAGVPVEHRQPMGRIPILAWLVLLLGPLLVFVFVRRSADR